MKHLHSLLRKALSVALVLFFLFSVTGYAQTIQWNNATSSVQWYTASNWTPATARTSWATTSVATFTDAGTRTIGINMASGSLSMQGIAISRISGTANLTVGNSSATPGTMTLSGAADGTIITANSGTTLNLVRSTPLALASMQLVLVQTESKIQSSMATVNIECNITGAGRGVKINGINGLVEFKGANTYTGNTNIEVPVGGSTRTVLSLNRPGGGTLPAANKITVANGGTLQVRTNQTINEITVTGSGRIIVENGATLTISRVLRTVPGSVVLNGTGRLIYSPGATLSYSGSHISTTTTSNEFPVLNGPTNVMINNIGITGLTLHASRTIPGFLSPAFSANLVLGNNNFTASSVANPISSLVTNGSGKLYLTNIGTTTKEFPITSGLFTAANKVYISNGGGLTYGVKVDAGISPALTGSNTAINRTWHIQPSATPVTPVSIILRYGAVDGNPDFNTTAPVNVLQYTTAWNAIASGLPPASPLLPFTISTLTSGTSSRIVVQNTPVMLRAGAAMHADKAPGKTEALVKKVTTSLASNVATGTVKLNFTSVQKITMQVSITDVAGKQLYTQVYPITKGSSQFNINVVGFAAGIYYLYVVAADGQTETLRFIKQ